MRLKYLSDAAKARTCKFSEKKLLARHDALTGITFFPKILAFATHAARSCGYD